MLADPEGNEVLHHFDRHPSSSTTRDAWTISADRRPATLGAGRARLDFEASLQFRGPPHPHTASAAAPAWFILAGQRVWAVRAVPHRITARRSGSDNTSPAVPLRGRPLGVERAAAAEQCGRAGLRDGRYRERSPPGSGRRGSQHGAPLRETGGIGRAGSTEQAGSASRGRRTHHDTGRWIKGKGTGSQVGEFPDPAGRRCSALMRWASSSWSSRMTMRQAASMGVPWSTISRARAAMRSW